MQYSPHLPQAYIALDKIVANYRYLKRYSNMQPVDTLPAALIPSFPEAGASFHFPWPEQMAVIKADAYGHGHITVAQALQKEGATLFASGSVQEAVALRQGLEESSGIDSPPAIIALLGLVSREDAYLCASHGIIPVVHSFEQLGMLSGTELSLAVAIKCNTGMARLGFNEQEIPLLREFLQKLPGVRPVLAMSHLHSADSENGKAVVAAQGAVFARFLDAFRQDWPEMAASLGNSAGTLLAGDIAEHIGPHVCRPGVALYGSNPFNGTSMAPLGEGLQPAMSVSAPIIAVRTLSKGEGFGYGHTFVANHDMTIGIVAAGYADCFARSQSNTGIMCVDNARTFVIGRVSMQMTAIDLSSLPENRTNMRPSTAWLLGGPHSEAVTAEELARLWGTITYEVFCLLGYNERVYAEYPESQA